MYRVLTFVLLAMLLAACGSSSLAAPPANGVEAFAQLKTQLAATSDNAKQQALVNDFLAQYPTMPLVAGDQAVFVVERAASRVVLTGDMTNWLQTIPMQQLGSTDVWAVQQTFSPTARLDYRFGVSGGGIFTDPRNPLLVPSSLGRNSELRMPEYVPPQEIEVQPDIPHGTLENLGLYQSQAASTTHELVVYLPPGYDPQQRYPSVYFQDGDDYRNYAFTPTIFDNAIAAGKLPPLIGVFVTPSREQGRQVDYDLNDAYVDFFVNELVPLIDSKYATLNDPSQRVVVGDSFGGLISLYIAYLHPDVFGGVVNQSGFVSRYNGRLISLYALQSIPSLRIDSMSGIYETCVGGPVTKADCNFLDGNRALRNVLQTNGYTYRYQEYPQGHAWGFWRDHIDDSIAWVLNYTAK